MKSRWARLFRWRSKQLGRQVSASDFSCENLTEYPAEPLYRALVDFRHLRTDARESAVRSYYRK